MTNKQMVRVCFPKAICFEFAPGRFLVSLLGRRKAPTAGQQVLVAGSPEIAWEQAVVVMKRLQSFAIN